ESALALGRVPDAPPAEGGCRMPRRRRAGKARTLTQQQADELALGWPPNGRERSCSRDCRPPLHDAARRCQDFRSYFVSEAEREFAWWANRSRFMFDDGSTVLNPGCRPRGWWLYEAKGSPPSGDPGDVLEWLAERGHIVGTEAAFIISGAPLYQN